MARLALFAGRASRLPPHSSSSRAPFFRRTAILAGIEIDTHEKPTSPILPAIFSIRHAMIGTSFGGQVLRKVAAFIMAAVICVGGMVLMVLAGILAVLLTDPVYPFWAAFAPMGLAVALLTAWAAGRVRPWLYPAHPTRQLWPRIAWAVSLAVNGLWGYGVADVLTSPINWQ
jgi:hypothetical protein